MSFCGRLRFFELVLITGLAVHALHTGIGLGGDRIDGFVDDWLYVLLLVGCGAGCLAAAASAAFGRRAWIALGIGLVCSAAGDAYFTLILGGSESAAYPSPADLLWLAFYPAAYVAVIFLLEERVENLNASVRLDGLIAGAAVTALGSAVLFPRLVDGSGDAATVATNLAYPLGDLLLVAAVVGVFGLTGRRSGRVFGLLAAGLLVTAAIDLVYLDGISSGTWSDGTLWDSLWPLGAYLLARASWTTAQPTERVDLRGRSLIVVPVLGGLVGVGVLVWDHFQRLHPVSVVAGAVVLVAVLGRLALTFRENGRMLFRVHEQALTDPLTGLGNRRSLLRDVERRLQLDAPSLLVLLDLDGFKTYNDTHGHPAGDAVLRRLGERLAQQARPYGRAYRMGGDEFCALLHVEAAWAETALHAVADALNEEGETFALSASFGAVLIPEEATTAGAALKLADQRLYQQKRVAQESPGGQSHDPLLRVLFEREPELHGHTRQVSELSRAVGTRLGLDLDEVDHVARAAELHDIGKLGIPDTILHKPGSLSPQELASVREHTLVGERILAASPALRSVAALVRASHERWDGTGYPDGLAGDAIPLGARIVAVCDAFDAMISDRPYRAAGTEEEALAELRRCAGTQFDPSVVEAFSSAWREAPPALASAAAG